MKLSKDLIGTTIYGIPTGNNVCSSSSEQQVVEFEVMAVGRKYLTLRRDGELWTEDKYCPKLGALQSEINRGYSYNAGYSFFTSLEAVALVEELKQTNTFIEEHYSTYRGFRNINLDQAKRILAILEE